MLDAAFGYLSPFLRLKRPTVATPSAVQLAQFPDLEQAPLLSHRVEVSTSRCVRRLKSSVNPRVDHLVIGIAESKEKLPNRAQLQILATHTHDIKKLTIFHVDKEVPWGKAANPLHQTLPFPSLLDVTIMSATTLEPSNITEGLLQELPEQIRFLHLLGNPGMQGLANTATPPPAFQLFGLTVQLYPSSATDWIFQTSASSLQCLTIGKVVCLPVLTSDLPNLRSLRILDPQDASLEGIQALERLEDLEIRAEHILELDLRILPPTVQHFRFWSTDVAKALSTERNTLKNLRTVAWDYWKTKNGREGRVLQRLQTACEAERVTLRADPRVDNGKRASTRQDPVWEEYLIRSCFADLDEAGQPSDQALSSLCQTPNSFPCNVLSAIVEENISLNAVLTETSFDTGVSHLRHIVEGHLGNHHAWTTNHLPKAQAKRDEKITSLRRNNLAVGGKKGWFAKFERKWPKIVTIGGAGISLITLILILTAFKDNLPLKFSILEVTALLVHLLQLSAIPVMRSGGSISPEILVNVARGMLGFLVVWGIGMIFAVTLPAYREGSTAMKRLSIAGPIVTVIVGITVWWRTGSGRMPFTHRFRRDVSKS